MLLQNSQRDCETKREGGDSSGGVFQAFRITDETLHTDEWGDKKLFGCRVKGCVLYGGGKQRKQRETTL